MGAKSMAGSSCFIARAIVLSAVFAFVAGCSAPGRSLWETGANARSSLGHAPGSAKDLLYVSTRNGIVMLTYPQGRRVGSFPVNEPLVLICSDPKTGNVFVPQSGVIEEYAHGGNSPIASLKPPKGLGVGACSVDARNGDLAVTCGGGALKGGGLLVYAHASGKPKVYSDANLRAADYPAYDDSGNVFVIGYNSHNRVVLYELLNRAVRLSHVSLADRYSIVTKDQWDGTYLTVGVGSAQVLQIKISGSRGSVANTVQLNHGVGDPYYWIFNGKIIAQSDYIKKKNNIGVGVWSYPSGDDPTKLLYGITKGRKDYVTDVTVSVTPSEL